MTLCSPAQKKKKKIVWLSPDDLTFLRSHGRYKTGEPVSLHDFYTEVEVVKVVLKPMGGAAYVKPGFPAARWDQSRVPGPLFFCRPLSSLPIKGESPSGLSQQNRAGRPIPGSWWQQQMANRQSKLVKPPNVLGFGFQIHEAIDTWPLLLLCIIFIWQHCPALKFPSLAQAKEYVHCISISTSQDSREFWG